MKHFDKAIHCFLCKFSRGLKLDYKGGSTKDSIVEWVVKKTSPPYLEVDCDTMITSVKEEKLAISYFGAEKGFLY